MIERERHMTDQLTDILQLSLFQSTGEEHTNYIALYDLAPRYTLRVDRMGSTALSSLQRDFLFNRDQYRVKVTPARILGVDGVERDELPGEREQLVEEVMRKFAVEGLRLGKQDEVLTEFSVNRIMKELSRHNHTFSRQEIKEALEILHKSTIEITRLVEPGSKKPQPVLSASAFPVLIFKDETDVESQSYVQLNPLVAGAIKALAYEQVNYDWMMQIKGQLPRWVFKNVSLLMTDTIPMVNMIEIRASDIANSFGNSRKRWREMLSEVSKAIAKLEDLGVVDSYVAKDVMVGKKKEDISFAMKFSDRFMADRRKAKERGEYMQQESLRHTGKTRPDKFQPISKTDGDRMRLEKKLGETIEMQLH